MNHAMDEAKWLVGEVLKEADKAWDQEVASALMQAGPEAEAVARMLNGTPELRQCFQAGVAWGLQKGLAIGLDWGRE